MDEIEELAKIIDFYKRNAHMIGEPLSDYIIHQGYRKPKPSEPCEHEWYGLHHKPGVIWCIKCGIKPEPQQEKELMPCDNPYKKVNPNSIDYIVGFRHGRECESKHTKKPHIENKRELSDNLCKLMGWDNLGWRIQNQSFTQSMLQDLVNRISIPSKCGFDKHEVQKLLCRLYIKNEASVDTGLYLLFDTWAEAICSTFTPQMSSEEEIAIELWSVFDENNDIKWPDLSNHMKNFYLIRARHILAKLKEKR